MRARNIKPAFFENEKLGDLPFEARLLFIGLWMIADRNGLLEDRPRRIKAQVFPYDGKVDVDKLLDALEEAEFIERYGPGYIHVLNFSKHQSIHQKEQKSAIPMPSPELRGNNRNSALNPESLNPESGRKDSSSEESQRKRTGTRLPQGWKPTPEDIAYAQREGFTDDEIGSIAEDFTDYWIAQPGQRGRKSDWSATWRTWIRRQRNPNRGNGSGYSHARDKSAMLEGLRRSALKNQAEEPASGQEPDRPGAVVTPLRQAGAA